MPLIQNDLNQEIRRQLIAIDGFHVDFTGFDCQLLVADLDEVPECPWAKSCGHTVRNCPRRERFYRLCHAPKRLQ